MDSLPKDQSTPTSAAFQPPKAGDLKPDTSRQSVPQDTTPSAPSTPAEPEEKPTPPTPTAPPTSIPPEPKLPTTPVTPPIAGSTPPLTPPAPPVEKAGVGPAKPPAGGKSNKAKIVGAVLGLLLLVVALPVAVFLVKQRQEVRKMAAPEDVPSCSGQTKIRCWGECQPGTCKEYEVCCTHETGGQCDAWCNNGLVNGNSSRCGGDCGGEPSGERCSDAGGVCVADSDCKQAYGLAIPEGGWSDCSQTCCDQDGVITPPEPPSDDCGYLCSQVTDCGVGPHQSFCHPSEDCRCVCNPEGNWNLSNPWCDADTHQYYCKGGQRKEDSEGELSDSNLQCAGDIPADSCKPRKTFSGATTTDYDCKKGKSASVTLEACIPEGCPAVDVSYSKTEAYCDCDLTDWEDCEWLGCEGACGTAPSTGTLHLGPGNWCDTVTASCSPRNLCGTCQVDIDGYGVRRWHDEGCGEEPEYEATCESCGVYNEDWEEITDLSTIEVGQTVYFTTSGSTDHPQGITKAKFRISVDEVAGAWQETTDKHGEEFYIGYTIPSEGSYKVESMVYNPVLGWY